MNGPSTAREALIAEVLGELDQLMHRCEALLQRMERADQNVDRLVAALGEATSKYRAAVGTFQTEAHTALRQYVLQSSRLLPTRTPDGQAAALRNPALAALGSETTRAALMEALEQVLQAARRSGRQRLFDILCTAALTAGLTLALVLLIGP